MGKSPITTGWWAKTTTPEQEGGWIPAIVRGMGAPVCSSVFPLVIQLAAEQPGPHQGVHETATAAFQPKWVIARRGVPCHLAATIRTGGAAKWVSVPPIETFTKSMPRVAYRGRLESPG